MNHNEEIKKVIGIIAEKAGIEVEEVDENLFFEDDLNIGELELAEILQDIEEELHVELMDQKDSIESVEDLLNIVNEQLE